jgi:hypothetical protein
MATAARTSLEPSGRAATVGLSPLFGAGLREELGLACTHGIAS